MERKGLRTKLDFRFNVEDLEIRDLNFLVEMPEEKRVKGIQVVKKSRRRKKKNNSELF